MNLPRIRDDPAGNTPVIIRGFGRMGQIAARVPRMLGIPFTALAPDPGQIDVVRRFGNKVYFGDPSRPDLLRSASAEQGKLLLVVLDDMEAVLRTVEVAKRNFPNLKILARARNGRHTHLLMDRNVDGLARDNFPPACVWRRARWSRWASGLKTPRIRSSCSATTTSGTWLRRTRSIATRNS